MEKSYYVSKDLAELLDVTEATIYKYIRDGKVVPYNKSTWTIDGEYRFSEEETLKLIDAQEEKPGLSTKDVADRLGITAYTVSRHIKNGVLPAKRKKYKGLERYFVSEEDFKTYALKVQSKKQEKLYDEELGFYLFQPLYNQHGDLAARVVNLEEPLIQSINGEYFSIEEAKELSYEGERKKLFEGKKVRKPGFVIFSFPTTDNIHSSFYIFMDYIMNQVGLHNVVVKQNSSTITFSVRSYDLTISKETEQLHIEIEEMINNYMIQGSFIQREKSIYLNSETDTIQAYIKTATKEKLKKEAIKVGVSMNEYVGNVLDRLYQNGN
ncbi:helix-turn-helix domain-containing protein [Alteribacillus bidgolensis]|uniref:Helix-turn-helix domain-containing protein n=1 Tax=Alteribacillus bidgolensis TaxID=930129 RepID=A0A1G8R1P3_9BACI|nr:helix-turn-helix domain-containing protein [Alteribacillus bidgolensis]SDJ10868.1 Helix-turn-helix domain-containing protein [Alteribacillus bidgolensis]